MKKKILALLPVTFHRYRWSPGSPSGPIPKFAFTVRSRGQGWAVVEVGHHGKMLAVIHRDDLS